VLLRKKFATLDLACPIREELESVRSPCGISFLTNTFARLNNPTVVFSLILPPPQGRPIITPIISVFDYYNTNYTMLVVAAIAFALALAAARENRSTLKSAPGILAVVSVA